MNKRCPRLTGANALAGRGFCAPPHYALFRQSGVGRGAQLVDQVRGLPRRREVHLAFPVRHTIAGEEDGEGGQARQDLVLAEVGVSGHAGLGTAALEYPRRHR